MNKTIDINPSVEQSLHSIALSLISIHEELQIIRKHETKVLNFEKDRAGKEDSQFVYTSMLALAEDEETKERLLDKILKSG